MNREKATPILLGLGGLGGGVVGFLLGTTVSNYEAVRPIATMSSYSIPAGQQYTIYIQNFPPNTQINGIQSLNPLTTVLLGTTDANGKLQINGTAVGPAGTYAIIVGESTGHYVAQVTFNVT